LAETAEGGMAKDAREGGARPVDGANAEALQVDSVVGLEAEALAVGLLLGAVRSYGRNCRSLCLDPFAVQRASS
jgi:hypothetical protein